ncbi:AraC family transcriptional regulator [Paenibacillus harenae]|uniref:AraC family transcriptional regulator n=1 Tax=Paenibacillus harenae TaxID=306543 RepID=UPI002795085C|nr:AraC family transcriptional regulator [Paenibacillus harenae]MDQ0062977.1 AraC-like DNA-binding protein [Paenibacillus harenae]
MKALPFYRNTFFTRLILSFTALAVVLLGLTGGYLYTQANQMMVDEIARDSQRRLVTAKDYVEQTLLRKYEENLQNKAVTTILTRSSSNLNYLLNNSWSENLDRVLSLQQDLEIFKTTIEGASNITVFFHQGNYVVSSDLFFENPENSTDFVFIEGLPQMTPNRWMVRTLPDGKQAMTYIVKLPYGIRGPSPKGYLYVDVDMEYLKQAVSKIMHSSFERFYIFDANGNLILQTTGANPEDVGLIRQAIRSGKTVTQINDSLSGTFVLSHLAGQESEHSWTYAMDRPMNSFVLDTKKLKTKIFVACCLMLVFGLAVSYLISKRFYLPMKKLIQHVRNLYQPGLNPGHANEYMIIGNALNFMDQKIVSLESQAKKNEMKNLVMGASLSLEHVDGLLQDCLYQVVHIQLIDGDSETFKMRYEQFDFPVPCEIVCLNPQEAAIIFFLDSRAEADDGVIAVGLDKFQDEVRGELRFGAGIGSSVESAEKIPLSYRVAHQAYRYRFMYGHETIIPHSRISVFDPKPPQISLGAFQNTLKAGDVESVNELIDEFAAVLMERNIQLESVELALLQLVSALYETIIELELQQIVPPSNLFDELKKDTLADTIASIRNLSERIGVHVRDSVKHNQAGVIFKLKAYIDEHLHEDLSLNILSEVASLAPSYISTLFGEVMTESFTEYVTRIRLEKAAHLLQEEDKLSVTEIASLVGYRNLQYFHVKFKARFGITPARYRQTKQTSSAAN